MKKLVVLLLTLSLVVAMCSVFLVACNTETIDYTKTIVFYSTQGDSLQQVTTNAIKSFEAKYPGWKIDHRQPGGYDEVKEKIVKDLSADVQPDLAYCYPDHVAQYMQTGKVVDMKGLINSTEVYEATGATIGYSAEEIADFVPGYYNEGLATNYGNYATYGFESDSMLTMPFVKSTELLYYNADALAALKLEPATTWDELWAQCEKIRKEYPSATPLGYDSEANWFITMCEQNGWGYTTAEGTNNYLFNNAETKAWLTEINGYFAKSYITTQSIYGAYTSELFKKGVDDGGLVYCIGSSGGASHQNATKFKWGVAPIPGSVQEDGSVNNSAISQGPSLVMFQAGYEVENIDEKRLMTWLFVKELLDPTFQAAFSIASGYNPCRMSTFEVPAYVEHMEDDKNITAVAARVASQMSERFFTSDAFKGSSTARDQVGKALVYVLKGQKDPDKALRDAYRNCGGK